MAHFCRKGFRVSELTCGKGFRVSDRRRGPRPALTHPGLRGSTLATSKVWPVRASRVLEVQGKAMDQEELLFKSASSWPRPLLLTKKYDSRGWANSLTREESSHLKRFPQALPWAPTPRPPQPCLRVGLQGIHGVLGANYQAV